MNNKKGFTLVELMAVIVILGSIMIFAVPVISNAIKSSRERVAEINLENVREAARVFGGQIMNCNNNNALIARSNGGIIFTLTRAPFSVAERTHRVYRECHRSDWPTNNTSCTTVTQQNNCTSKNCAFCNLTTTHAQAFETTASILRVLNCCDIKTQMEGTGFNIPVSYLRDNDLLKDNGKCTTTGTINIRIDANEEFIVTLPDGFTCEA